ncbi:EamA/RhaT family transporter [Falsiroseomonas bella]|uniref:EamA/RhaT family transporter n=1 Tax=Falsiroseomonas bella TaxID=2184016 RepID=A0A317FHI5_9PROT|nr:DMT family transporter [Falsiroseomonas bella]PWS37497.1 EamA/RhaT family transporter [Falsiroseomonas bella]
MWPAIRLLLVAILLFGGAWPVTKAALADATPLWFGTSRAGLAALVAFLLLAVLGRLRLPRREDMRAVLGLGIFQLGLFFVLTHLAVALVPAGRTAVLSNVVAYWLIPLSVLLLGERVSPARWAAAGISLAGAAVLIGPWAVDWGNTQVVLGHIMLVTASLAWVIAIIATRRWPPRTPIIQLLPWCFALGTLVLAPLALLLEPDGGIGRGAWTHMLFIGLFAAPVGTFCVIEASRRLPGAVASVWFLLIPAFGVLVSALWLGEPIGWDVILGGVLVVVSVLIAARG